MRQCTQMQPDGTCRFEEVLQSAVAALETEPCAAGCNGMLCVAGHLRTIIKERDKYRDALDNLVMAVDLEETTKKPVWATCEVTDAMKAAKALLETAKVVEPADGE